MEKIELKHLSCYLPYGLKIQIYPNEIVELIGFNRNTIYHTTGYFVELPCNLKPILRPLSDLTKEIEHNGEIIEPIEYLIRNRDCDAEYDFIEAITDDWASADSKMIFAPYSIMQKLFEWHFDVFDLHSKGLCIYYNEL